MSNANSGARDSGELTAKLSRNWAFPPSYLGAAAFLSVLFLYFNFMPLNHTDLWGHVLYGNWILDHRTLPTEDPFVPLAKGIPITATAWLSQIILAATERGFGADGLSHLYALASIATFVVLARALYLRIAICDPRVAVASSELPIEAGSVNEGGVAEIQTVAPTGRWQGDGVSRHPQIGWVIFGVAIALFLAWGRLAFFRPETLAAPCFGVLLWCIAVMERQGKTPLAPVGRWLGEGEPEGAPARRNWLPFVTIPIIFILWANLHGSFAVGIVFLGCWATGRTIDAMVQARSIKPLFQSFDIACWWILVLLSIAATLINPYGLHLLIATVSFSGNPNLEHITEWSRLRFSTFGGVRVMASWIALGMLLNVRGRRFSFAEILCLAVFSVALLKSGRFLNWYALVFVFAVLPHLTNALRSRRNNRCLTTGIQARSTSRRSGHAHITTNESGKDVPVKPWEFRYTLLTALVLWTAFAVSPLGGELLAHRKRQPRQLYSAQTPRPVSQYLREFPPDGLVLNPQTCGDWLIWDGPPGLQLFITTNTVHVVSPEVFRDYLSVHYGRPQWGSMLVKYGINTIVVSKETQPELYQLSDSHAGWQVLFEQGEYRVLNRIQLSR